MEGEARPQSSTAANRHSALAVFSGAACKFRDTLTRGVMAGWGCAMVDTIKYRVGYKGINATHEVRLVQKLLNRARLANASFAAAVPKLAEDDDIGPKTITAIEKFQEIVLKWSAQASDGAVDPGGKTWKALNGNVGTPAAIKKWNSTYSVFNQNTERGTLGATTQTIARSGCTLCTLTMAATYLGAPTKYWPEGLQPQDLTPPKANAICYKAKAFSGYELIVKTAAEALGMLYVEYGREIVNGKGVDYSLEDWHLTLLDTHLRTERPVAAHVDYHSGTKGDHWILVVQRNGDHTYTAIDPATGGTMILMSGRNQSVNHARYAQIRDRRTGILFGTPQGQGSQKNYVVVRFGLLA